MSFRRLVRPYHCRCKLKTVLSPKRIFFTVSALDDETLEFLLTIFPEVLAVLHQVRPVLNNPPADQEYQVPPLCLEHPGCCVEPIAARPAREDGFKMPHGIGNVALAISRRSSRLMKSVGRSSGRWYIRAGQAAQSGRKMTP